MTSPEDDLLRALEPLDRLLDRAVSAAQRAGEPDAIEDRFRGLYVGSDDVQELLGRGPGGLPRWSANLGSSEPEASVADPPVTRFSSIARSFALDTFDIGVLLIALAPDLDLRYERIYAYLQDDVTKRRPTIDLALNLLCGSAAAKHARLSRFASGAALVRDGLLTLVTDPNATHAPLLAHALKVDDQIVGFLEGSRSLDARLVQFCDVWHPEAGLDALPIEPASRRSLRALLSRAEQTDEPLRLYFRGADNVAKRLTAEAVAAERARPLLTVDCQRMPAGDVERLAALVFREAWFRDAVLYLDNLDTIRADDRSGPLRGWLRLAARHRGPTIFAGDHGWHSSDVDAASRPLGVSEMIFGTPTHAQRRDWWRQYLAAQEVALEPEDIDVLAGRFHLTASQIAEAAASVRNHAISARAAEDDSIAPEACARAAPTLADCFATARARCTLDVGSSARKITPVHEWADIILPADAMQQLRELCERVTHRHIVLGDWGFRRTLSLGRGVSALFAGTSGTGKTMAAEIVARELGLDLYKIDLAGVVSKYIGETEKNLDRVFTAAEHANAILFFDEADALFGKRSEVRDSHDRYANIEISYLLQKMDQYEGVAVLATNLRENMDEAFVRRLQFVIEFPFPDETHRRALWRGLFPPETPRDAAIDYAFLAKHFRLTGGHIKNIVLGASYLAATNGGCVEMKHLIKATWRECEKMGRALSADDFGPYAESLP